MKKIDTKKERSKYENELQEQILIEKKKFEKE